MANTSSAKKAQRVADRRRVFNVRRKKAMQATLKATGKHVSAKSAKEAQASLAALYQALDKAAKNGTIKENKAARLKSRITKRVAALAK